jgi:hypothetical protein
LQLLNVKKRIQIILHIAYFAYVNGAVAIYYASTVAVAMVYATVAIID